MIHFWAAKDARVELDYRKQHIGLFVGGKEGFGFLVNGFDVRVYGPRDEHIAIIDVAGRSVALIEVVGDLEDRFSLNARGNRYVVEVGDGQSVHIACNNDELRLEVWVAGDLAGALKIKRGEPCDERDE